MYIDLFKVSSFKGLLELYTAAISKAAETRIEKNNRFVRDFFPNIHPRIVIASDGRSSIEIDYEIREKNVGKLFEEVYLFNNFIISSNPLVFTTSFVSSHPLLAVATPYFITAPICVASCESVEMAINTP